MVMDFPPWRGGLYVFWSIYKKVIKLFIHPQEGYGVSFKPLNRRSYLVPSNLAGYLVLKFYGLSWDTHLFKSKLHGGEKWSSAFPLILCIRHGLHRFRLPLHGNKVFHMGMALVILLKEFMC
jgi:hypothetical protein